MAGRGAHVGGEEPHVSALGLTLVWLPVSLLFVVSRSLVGALVLNNLMALIGVVTNGLALPGTPATGWLQAALACVVFIVVFRLTIRGQPAPTPDSAG